MNRGFRSVAESVKATERNSMQILKAPCAWPTREFPVLLFDPKDRHIFADIETDVGRAA